MEREVILKFNVRDSVAFEEVYNLLYEELSFYVASLSGWNSDLAKDIADDVFINVWLTNTSFENYKHLRSYFYTTARNLYFKHLEHNKHVRNYELEYKKEHHVAPFVECAAYTATDAALNLLPEKYAEILRLYINGYKMSEIAILTERSEQSVYNMKHEAIKRLKALIDKDKMMAILLLLK